MKKHYSDIISTLPHNMTTPRSSGKHPTLEEAVTHINSIDFLPIQKKLCSDDTLICRRWSEIEVEVGIQYYKNFLYLNKKYIEQYPVLPPSLEIDEIWHHHILDTRQYLIDCNHIFGYYFHHYPYFGTRGENDKQNLDAAFDVTQALHEIEFGEKILAIWDDKIEL